MSFQEITRTDLSAVEEENLVRIVRATERATVADDDGQTIIRFFPTPQQDAAMERLIGAYINDIRRAARTSRVIDREDAEMVATEKFMSLARRDTGRSNERLAGFVSRAMVNAVMDADAEASAIRIPPDTLRRYFNLIRDTGSVEAAYVACKDPGGNLDPITLLAVHRALNAESIEALQSARTTSSNNDGSAINESTWGPDSQNWERNGNKTPSPEETVVQADLVRYLFTIVTDEQETILRLAHGFLDTRSEGLRIQGGYPFDACLSDAQISPVVARSRASVQRARTEGLRAMHRAVMAAVTA